MSNEFFIRTYLDVFEPNLCDALVHYHQNLVDKGKVGVTKNGAHIEQKMPSFKYALGTQVSDGPDVLLKVVNQRLETLREQYFRDIGIDATTLGRFRCVDPQVQHYPQGEGFYKKHVDVGPRVLNRSVSFIVYLNDVEEGGETVFLTTEKTIKPTKGKVIVFPPFWMFPHLAQCPLSNDKYVLITIHETEPAHVGY